LEPVAGPLDPGPVIVAKMPSACPRGRLIRLAPGLIKLPPAWPVVGGSISSDERKDVLSKSVLVLVIVRKESRRLFSMALGVPFKSRIYRNHFSIQRETWSKVKILLSGSWNRTHLLSVVCN
jgi:hypothetical protein